MAQEKLEQDAKKAAEQEQVAAAIPAAAEPVADAVPAPRIKVPTVGINEEIEKAQSEAARASVVLEDLAESVAEAVDFVPEM
jgi:hypothetical protein